MAGTIRRGLEDLEIRGSLLQAQPITPLPQGPDTLPEEQDNSIDAAPEEEEDEAMDTAPPPPINVPEPQPQEQEDLMNSKEVTQANARQALLISPEMKASTVSVVGCGMVGSWTALAMSRAVAQLNIWDGDVVEIENLGCQAYDRLDVGTPKVNALAVKMSGMRVVSYMGEMPPDYDLLGSVEGMDYSVDRPIRDIGNVVVMAVDSMLSRREIVRWIIGGSLDVMPSLVLDARVYGELATVVAINPRNTKQVREYLDGLPEDEDTPDAPCGEEGTAYTGMWTAARLVAMTNNHFRNERKQEGVEQVSWHVGINMSTQGAVDKAKVEEKKIPVFTNPKKRVVSGDEGFTNMPPPPDATPR